MNWYKFFAIVTIFGVLGMMAGIITRLKGWVHADALLAFAFPFFATGLCSLIWFLFLSLKKKNEA